MHAQVCEDGGRNVDGEIVAWIEGTRSNQRHNRNECLRDHCAVADESRIGFLVQHLRSCAGRNERVEPGDSAACNRHEQKGKQLAFDEGSAAVDVLGHGWKLKMRMHEEIGRASCRERGWIWEVAGS